MKRLFAVFLPFSLILSAGSGCMGNFPPDQSQFKPLSYYESTDEPVVRLYGEYIFGLPILHSSFAVKEANSSKFDRWEGWLASVGPFDYVQKNASPPGASITGGEVFAMAELVGKKAEKVVNFIETESPRYPCRHIYSLMLGPNSNTYTEWVLDKTGWDVKLPEASWGKNSKPHCQ